MSTFTANTAADFWQPSFRRSKCPNSSKSDLLRRKTIAGSYRTDGTCAWLSPALSLALALMAKRLF